MSTETADILDEAANVIERNGWIQGDYVNQRQIEDGKGPGDCACCARGAINTAAGGSPYNDYLLVAIEASNAVETWLTNSGAIGETLSLVEWNDKDGRTADDVITALRGAAQAERERAA